MSLTPARYNFTIYQGATFFKSITYTVDGETQDLTGYTSELIIKDEPSGKTLLTLTTEAEAGESGIGLDEEKGIIELTITDEDTAELAWQSGVYELFITDETGRTDLLLRGGFKVVFF